MDSTNDAPQLRCDNCNRKLYTSYYLVKGKKLCVTCYAKTGTGCPYCGKIF